MLRGLICHYQYMWGRKINNKIRFWPKMDIFGYSRASSDHTPLATDIINYLLQSQTKGVFFKSFYDAVNAKNH